MEFDFITNLSTPAGIALITGIIVQFVKSKFTLDTGNKWYSLIIIGMNLGISGLLAWLGYFLLPLSGMIMTIEIAFFNWLNGWIIAAFGYQILKAVDKTKYKQ